MSFKKDLEAVGLSSLYHMHKTVVNVRLSGCMIHHGLCDRVASTSMLRGKLAASRNRNLHGSGLPQRIQPRAYSHIIRLHSIDSL